MSTTHFETARQMAQIMLKAVSPITMEAIREQVQAVSRAIPALTLEEGELLIRQLEASCNVLMGRGLALDDKTHQPWLDNKRAEIRWNFWRRYRRYLEEDKGMPEAVIQRLDQLTDDILTRLENPARPGAWDRRGMVVGQVQSGKTANYTGLVCKAADAGYKVIIVLAGIHNSLRSQTQLRLDEGFLGFDTEKHRAFDQGNIRKGVGLLVGEEKIVAHSLTSCVEQGDFNSAVARKVSFTIGGNDPVILVVKKNASVLKNLNKWATEQIHCETDPKTNKKYVPDIPILVIDDEADNASINTSTKKKTVKDLDGNEVEENSPTAINGLIRQFLGIFKKSAYVGYTATPFANIFIRHDEDTPTHGEDLFPRSFIINMPAPSNYVGPVQVFGLEDDQSSDIQGRDGLPIVRLVQDWESWMPLKHRASHVPGELPDTLRQAIRAFILTSAARMARGQGTQHNSMLVHTTRFMEVQARVTDLVREELGRLRRRLEYGDENSPEPVIPELKRLWEDDFAPTSEALAQTHSDVDLVSWDAVTEQLFAAVSRIQVKTINGTASDVLDYHRTEGGQYVIAIGGDKLSRGLTLEGLSVSYYLRASTMYDTLMQMGRWFGYRPGYLDLCRLYTTPELVSWYRHIALASEELRKEFEYMAHIGSDPTNFGLRVRTHSAGMTITGISKMRSGTKVKLSYAGDVSETIVFHKEPDKVARNFELVCRFLAGRPTEKVRNSHMYRNISSAEVIAFLREFITHGESRRARANLLAEYIEKQNDLGELTDWTVALITNTAINSQTDNGLIGGQQVNYTYRKEVEETRGTDSYTIKRLLSPADESLDLAQEEREQAILITQQMKDAAEEVGMKGRLARTGAQQPFGNGDEEPVESAASSAGSTPRISGKAARRVRTPDRGLLLLYALDTGELVYKGQELGDTPIMGLGISFPESSIAQPIEYHVNNVYYEMEYGEEAVLV
jgi:hypothetical protein